MENSFDAIALFGADGTILYGSPSTTQILGYTLDEFVGGSAFALIHPDDQNYVQSRMLLALEQPRIGITVSARVRHKSGAWCLLEGIFTNLLDEPGVHAIVNNYRDVTERRQAEDAVRASEAQLAGIIESAMDAIITVDAAQRIVLFNAAAEKLFDCQAKDVLGEPLDGFIPQRYEIGHAQHLGQFGEDGITNRRIGQVRALTALRRDGSEFPIEASISRVHTTDSVLDTVILRDETARRQVQAQIAYQAGLIDNVSDAIISTNKDFGIESWNRAAETIYGWRADEVLHLDSTALLQTEYFNSGREQVLATLRETGVWQGEVSQQRKDGTRVTVYSSVSVWQDNQAGHWGAVAVNRDITGLKHAEAALQRSEQVLGLFIENAPAAIAMFDCEMKYIATSRRFLADYHLGEQSLVGRSHYAVFPALASVWKEIHKRTLAGETVQGEDDAFLQADGTLDYVHWEMRPWFEQSGEIGGIILFSEMITDRKRAELAIKAGAQRAHTMSWLSQELSKAGPDLSEVLETTVAHISSLMGGICSLALVSPDGKWVDSIATYYSDPTISAAMQELMLAERVPWENILWARWPRPAKPSSSRWLMSVR